MTSSEFIDNRTGIVIASGASSVRNTVIRDDSTTAATPLVGIAIVDGDTLVQDVVHTGQRSVGISQVTQRLGCFDPNSSLLVERTPIEGGAVGSGTPLRGIDALPGDRDVTGRTVARSQVDSCTQAVRRGLPR